MKRDNFDRVGEFEQLSDGIFSNGIARAIGGILGRVFMFALGFAAMTVIIHVFGL